YSSPTKTMNEENSHRSLIFLAGVPATGKSTYGQWLEDRHGFIHVDFETSQEDPIKSGIYQKFMQGDVNSFHNHFLSLETNIILSWGFVPDKSLLTYLQALKDKGVEMWWFNADRLVAREAFIARDELPGSEQIGVNLFDLQMDRIEHKWPQIE